jgi:hypothetical protein
MGAEFDVEDGSERFSPGTVIGEPLRKRRQNLNRMNPSLLIHVNQDEKSVALEAIRSVREANLSHSPEI